MNILRKSDKYKIDYKYIQNILENKQSAIINCEYILMDIKPYRRNIFLQIYGKKNQFEKVWRNKSPEEKLEWIQTELMKKFDKDEFVEHILKAISMFSTSEKMVKTFYLALEVDFNEVKQNV